MQILRSPGTANIALVMASMETCDKTRRVYAKTIL